MIKGAQIQAAIDILDEVYFAKTSPMDQVVNLYLKPKRYIGSSDRRIIVEHVYDIMRNFGMISWWCEICSMHPGARNHMIMHLLLQSTGSQDLGTIFSGQQYHPKPFEKYEEKAIEFFHKNQYLKAQIPLTTKLNIPTWSQKYFERTFGDHFEEEVKAFQGQARFDLRVNLLKGKREDIHFPESSITPLSPWGIYFDQRTPIYHHDLFKKGVLEVQDEGSQLVSKLVGAQPGHLVVDFCAGAGGKSLAMAAMMENKGRIILSDIAQWRLDKAKLRLRKAGVCNHEERILSEGLNDKWIKRLHGKVDRLLLDVPCSGTGTWRRNPEAKWRLTQNDITELLVKQKTILEASYKMVKIGGYLVYATCSLFMEENDDQIEAFLKDHPEFEKGETLKLTPLQSQTDGFFAQILIRR
jgi:16S rRNA (cytosine967-C5)-methyltransferase